MRKIHPDGPRDAKIILIGESPWTSEDYTGKPFAGASGNLLERIWWDVGLTRGQIYIDNVYPFKPPHSTSKTKDKLSTVPRKELVNWMNNLHERIAGLEDPYVIVPTGNYATYTLLKKGKIPARVYSLYGSDITTTEAEKKAGITNLRGSIYQYIDLTGRKIKVIPTIHPASLFTNPGWYWRTVQDWKRIYEESFFKSYIIPQRNINWNVTEDDVIQFIIDCQHNSDKKVSIDIETWGNTLSCVGFANSSTNAIVLKTVTKEEKKRWLPWIEMLCNLENEKILQNGTYDGYWLKGKYNIDIKNWIWDTLLMHHALDPRESHSLEFLCSIYTRQPYYKDEAKNAEEIKKYASKLQALWHYNGLDVTVTYEVFGKLYNELVKKDRLDFYASHYRDMLYPLLGTMLHGIRVDVEEQKRLGKELLKECNELREKLKVAAGEELYSVKYKTKERKPTEEEWEELVGEDYQWQLTLDGKKEIPKAKYINRDVKKKLNYVMTRGVIRYKKEVLGKSFAPQRLLKFAYETLSLPIQRNKDGGKSLDEKAIRKLLLKFPEKAKPLLWIIQHRGKQKEYEIVKGAWDKDGRIRCTYGFTKTGRLKSYGNPMRKGYNLQNVKKGRMRSTFLVDGD